MSAGAACVYFRLCAFRGLEGPEVVSDTVQPDARLELAGGGWVDALGQALAASRRQQVEGVAVVGFERRAQMGGGEMNLASYLLKRRTFSASKAHLQCIKNCPRCARKMK